MLPFLSLVLPYCSLGRYTAALESRLDMSWYQGCLCQRIWSSKLHPELLNASRIRVWYAHHKLSCDCLKWQLMHVPAIFLRVSIILSPPMLWWGFSSSASWIFRNLRTSSSLQNMHTLAADGWLDLVSKSYIPTCIGELVLTESTFSEFGNSFKLHYFTYFSRINNQRTNLICKKSSIIAQLHLLNVLFKTISSTFTLNSKINMSQCMISIPVNVVLLVKMHMLSKFVDTPGCPLADPVPRHGAFLRGLRFISLYKKVLYTNV